MAVTTETYAMRIITANGRRELVVSRADWLRIGQVTGWIRRIANDDQLESLFQRWLRLVTAQSPDPRETRDLVQEAIAGGLQKQLLAQIVQLAIKEDFTPSHTYKVLKYWGRLLQIPGAEIAEMAQELLPQDAGDNMADIVLLGPNGPINASLVGPMSEDQIRNAIRKLLSDRDRGKVTEAEAQIYAAKLSAMLDAMGADPEPFYPKAEGSPEAVAPTHMDFMSTTDQNTRIDELIERGRKVPKGSPEAAQIAEQLLELTASAKKSVVKEARVYTVRHPAAHAGPPKHCQSCGCPKFAPGRQRSYVCFECGSEHIMIPEDAEMASQV